MRKVMRLLLTAFVITLAPGLSACLAPQTETADAARDQKLSASPTPSETLLPVPGQPVPGNIDEAQVQGQDPTATPSPDTASATQPTTPVNTALSSAMPNDTRVVINAPAYRMDLFENGRLIKSYQIGIGYPEYPLPTGMRTANTIIFNPEWTPPDEPWVESPSSKVKVGQKIEAGSELNPLGLVKIPIGSPSLIHGGKAPSQLGGFASHGCVGLTNAQAIDFSKRLAALGGVEITDSQIAKYRQNRSQTRNIPLQNPVQIELRYETIVIQDGKLYIYRDVYGRGMNTQENLRTALGAYGLTLESLSENERSQALFALDQMSRNATGKPVPAATPSQLINAATGPSPSDEANRKKSAMSRRVTRRVKGQKELVVEIASLAGRGYAAPIDLDTGKNVPRSTIGNRPSAQTQR